MAPTVTTGAPPRCATSYATCNEFAGAEPSPQILDAIGVYIQDIDFLPNPRLDVAGHLGAGANRAERRGEALFRKPFPHDPGLSCATCHQPAAAFVDHREHDVGSGGLYKTPTLLNADFNAPYFHVGRFTSYAEVIEHFDREFRLGLTPQNSADLAAYVAAIGDGVRPEYHLTGTNVLEDIDGFASVLDIAITTHDREVIALAVGTVGDQLQELAEHYPDAAAAEISGGEHERVLARATIARLVAILRGIDQEVIAGRFEAAADDYLSYRRLTLAAAPRALQAAEPWSLFNPSVYAAHRASRQQSAVAHTAAR